MYPDDLFDYELSDIIDIVIERHLQKHKKIYTSKTEDDYYDEVYKQIRREFECLKQPIQN